MPTAANSLNISSVGLVNFDGTSVFTGVTLTQHDVLVGAASNSITSVAPSATSGVPLISQGAASDPAFGTAVVAGGGTGRITLTNHGVLVGAGTTAITQLAAGSSGQVLQSGGASADPSYSTATFPATATSTGTILRADGTNWVATTSTYPNTNAVSTLLYASATNVMSALATANGGVLVTSNTGVPSILAGSGTSGQVLQAVSGAAPAWSTPTYPSTSGTARKMLVSDGTNNVYSTETWAVPGSSGNILKSDGTNWVSVSNPAFVSIVVQVFTSTGTYTPTSGMLYCTIEVVGGGGGGAGVAATDSTHIALGGGGGGGGYARKTVTAATIGVSQSVTIGAAGTGGTGNNGGGTGGTTSVGAIVSASGGGGGVNGSSGSGNGGAGGLGSSGDININGAGGGMGAGVVNLFCAGSFGGTSYFGGGAASVGQNSGHQNGGNGTAYGGGGGGGMTTNSSGTAANGGSGFAGVVVITEYI